MKLTGASKGHSKRVFNSGCCHDQFQSLILQLAAAHRWVTQRSGSGHGWRLLPFKQMDLEEGEKGEGDDHTLPFLYLCWYKEGGGLVALLNFDYEGVGASFGVSTSQSLGVTVWAGRCCSRCSQQPVTAGCNYKLQLQRKLLAVGSVQCLAADPLLLRIQWRWRK